MAANTYEHVTHRKRKILFNNFLGGIAWGIGATVGFSIVLALIALFVRVINPVPVVGDFVTSVYEYVLQNNPRLPEHPESNSN